MAKKLYVYNKETREYMGYLGDAQIDPLESEKRGKEVLVIPPNCTLVPPIEFHEILHENILFNKHTSTWEKVKDYRGTEGYDRVTGKPIIITDFGELPENFTYEKPIDFQEEKMKKFNDLNVAYSNAQQENVLYGEVEGNVDLRVRIQTLINQAGSLDYITLDLDTGKTVILTIRQAKNAVKFYSVRNILLPIRKNEIAEKIRRTSNMEELNKIELDFDVTEETKKIVKMSVDNINSYIAERLA